VIVISQEGMNTLAMRHYDFCYHSICTAIGCLLWTRWWTFGCHKSREVYWLAELPLASQEELSSMELVS